MTLDDSVRDARVADAIEIAAWRDMYAAATPSQKKTLGLDVVTTISDATVFVARGVPMAMFNRAMALGNERDDVTEADLDRVVHTLDEKAAPKIWVQHGPASSATAIGSWLEARGLHPAPRAWMKLLRDNTPPPPPSPAPTSEDSSFEIREIGEEQARAFAKTLADAHGMPVSLAAWTEQLIGRDGWHAIAAFDGDALVAGGMVYVFDSTRTRTDENENENENESEKSAWLGLGGTLAAYRDRGAQAAIVSRRIAVAIAGGATILATETGEHVEGERRAPAFDNVIRAGFRIVAKRLNYERPLPEERPSRQQPVA